MDIIISIFLLFHKNDRLRRLSNRDAAIYYSRDIVRNITISEWILIANTPDEHSKCSLSVLLSDVSRQTILSTLRLSRRSSETLRFSAVCEAGRHKVVSLTRIVIGQLDLTVF